MVSGILKGLYFLVMIFTASLIIAGTLCAVIIYLCFRKLSSNERKIFHYLK